MTGFEILVMIIAKISISNMNLRLERFVGIWTSNDEEITKLTVKYKIKYLLSSSTHPNVNISRKIVEEISGHFMVYCNEKNIDLLIALLNNAKHGVIF